MGVWGGDRGHAARENVSEVGDASYRRVPPIGRKKKEGEGVCCGDAGLVQFSGRPSGCLFFCSDSFLFFCFLISLEFEFKTIWIWILPTL
jgi:hypothetical protein